MKKYLFFLSNILILCFILGCTQKQNSGINIGDSEAVLIKKLSLANIDFEKELFKIDPYDFDGKLMGKPSEIMVRAVCVPKENIAYQIDMNGIVRRIVKLDSVKLDPVNAQTNEIPERDIHVEAEDMRLDDICNHFRHNENIRMTCAEECRDILITIELKDVSISELVVAIADQYNLNVNYRNKVFKFSLMPKCELSKKAAAMKMEERPVQKRSRDENEGEKPREK